MTINERIKMFRKSKKLSQKQFALSLGVTQSGVSYMEQDGSTVSDASIKTICSVYGLNEEWLRSGTEPMVDQSDTFSLDQYLQEKGCSALEISVVKSYFQLDSKTRQAVFDFFRSRLDAAKERLAAEMAPPPEAAMLPLELKSPVDMTDEEIDSIQSFDGLTVLSYQQVEAQLKEKDFILTMLSDKRFRYVVFDEVHYFLQDCMFNRDICYWEGILTRICNATKIFLSATIDEIQPYIMYELHSNDRVTEEIEIDSGRSYYKYAGRCFTNGRIINYKKMPQFNIAEIFYFRDLSDLLNEINSSTDEKWLVFVNRLSKRKNLILRFL